MNRRKINTTDKFVLNKRFISEINVHEMGANDFRGILDNIRLFIEQALRRGNCISLNEVDYIVSENTFWDIEFFEEYCRNLYFSFKKGFTVKLKRKIKQINQVDLLYFHQTLTANFTPYENVFDPNTNSYQQFIGKKLRNLSKGGLLDEVNQLDKENRTQLLIALKDSISKNRVGTSSDNQDSSQDNNHLVFTNLLIPIDGSKENTKMQIQKYLTNAGISFELFSLKPIKQRDSDSNPKGFQGAVAATIFVFKNLGYFEKRTTFNEILDAYLQETGNEISKLSYFKRHYLNDNYFIQYKEDLESILPQKLS